MDRPWGKFDVVVSDDRHWYKIITVLPGKRLSLQYHEHRDEFWIIQDGDGVVQIQDDVRPASRGDSFFVPRGHMHRITNTSDAPLVFSEIAIGTRVSEDDIVRVHDDFGRK